MSQPNESVIPSALKQSIIDTFKVQLGTDAIVTAKLTSADEARKIGSQLDVISVMGLKGTGYGGSIALGFPKSTFLKIVETMIGETHTDISNENADACSELLNIIYASARVKINEAGFNFQPAIPATVCGKDLSLPLGQFTQFINFHCETNKGHFILALSLKRSE